MKKKKDKKKKHNLFELNQNCDSSYILVIKKAKKQIDLMTQKAHAISLMNQKLVV